VLGTHENGIDRRTPVVGARGGEGRAVLGGKVRRGKSKSALVDDAVGPYGGRQVSGLFGRDRVKIFYSDEGWGALGDKQGVRGAGRECGGPNQRSRTLRRRLGNQERQKSYFTKWWGDPRDTQMRIGQQTGRGSRLSVESQGVFVTKTGKQKCEKKRESQRGAEGAYVAVVCETEGKGKERTKSGKMPSNQRGKKGQETAFGERKEHYKKISSDEKRLRGGLMSVPT